MDGFRDAHKKVAAEEFLAEGSSNPETRAPLSYRAFLKDVFLYSLFVDLFAKAGIEVKARRALDLGGGEGAMARLMKSDRTAAWTRVVELYDMRKLLPDDQYKSYLRRHRLSSLLYRLGLRNSALRPTLFGGLDYWPNKSDKFFNIGGDGDGQIDEYTMRDFYALDDRYDLLTAFSCVDYFVPQEFFAKAGKLVESGGLMYLHLAYWWFPVNCSLAIGDFPFAPQRLTFDEFSRYLEEFHPDEAKNTVKLYNYFHQGTCHPVADDYIDWANENGFELVAMRRMMPLSEGAKKMTRFTVDALADDPDHNPTQVLSEIRRHSPKVQLADLKTFNLLLGFVRR
jgi:hypothetical protein